MTPGTYLRLRREAAGLSIEQVAVRIAARPSSWQADAALLAACETDQPGQYLALAFRLTQAFRFDFLVWEELAEHAADSGCELPRPRVCAGCGCTWNDPCRDHRTGAACAWRPRSETSGDDLCTSCPVPAGAAA